MDVIIRFFSSVRVALWVILLLAIISLAGSLLIQMPPSVAENEAFRESWLEQEARPRYEGLTDVYNAFGLFDVFHSPIFLALGSLLIVNITVCSLKRWPSLAKASRGLEPEDARRLLDKGTTEKLSSKLSTGENAGLIRNFLQARGYRLKESTIHESSFFVADKNRFAPWGTYAIHLSLILLVAGYLIGSFFGYTDNAFIIAENETRTVGGGYDFSLRLVSFEDEYYEDGTPKDYRSQLQVISGGQVVEEALVRVNYPLNYQGLKVYQTFYGPSVDMVITGPEGVQIYHQPVALSESFEDTGIVRYYNTFNLETPDLTIAVFSSSSAADPVIPAGHVRLEFYNGDLSQENFIDFVNAPIGEATEFQGLNYVPQELGQFSGFQLREDPGLIVIWIAFTLFMLGLGIVFYFPHRQILVAAYADAKGSKLSYTAMGKRSQANADIDDFAELIGTASQKQSKKSGRES